MQMSVNIISVNVRGIKDTIKRRSIFNHYRARANVICLQETHSTKDDESIWQAEWGGQIIFSHGQSNARGVCILITNELPYQIVKTSMDIEGRIIACELENIDDPTKRLALDLCCVYGPNNDRPSFFMEMYKMVAEMSSKLVLIGDFNTVQDINKDRKGSVYDHKMSREMLSEISEESGLVDIWRLKNPDERRYSWMRTKPVFKVSQIDYAMIMLGLIDATEQTMYLPGILTDHTAFYLSLSMTSNPRGRGYWKFNSMLI